MSKKDQICNTKECAFGLKKCLRAHSPLDWYPSQEFYTKYPGKWDEKHRDHVAKEESLVFHMTLKEAKDSLSYYYIAKFNEDVDRHLQFFVSRPKKLEIDLSDASDEKYGCSPDECSSPFVDPIKDELEKARLEYEEKVRRIKDKPRRQAELLQEQEVLKAEVRAFVEKVNDFKLRWSQWFAPEDARLTI